jgi:phthalate 4,5-cis-dihydrodiol dehydrogenase
MNVGILGAGFFGEKHAQALSHVDGMRLVASCRTRRDEVEAFAARYGGAAYTDPHALLADPRVDAVVVATPHATHAGLVEAAAAAGKHVLVEKPMAQTPTECRRILAAVERAGVTLRVGHVTQFSRAYRIAKQLLEAGELGTPVAGVATMRKLWQDPGRRAWHLDRRLGGGVLLTGGVHAIDRLTWLLGARATRVSAIVGTRFHEQPADDAAVLFVRYEGGAAGVVFSIGYRDGAPRHDTELTCTRGILRVDSVAGVSIGRGEAWHEVPDSGDRAWIDEALVAQWRAFGDAVAGRGGGVTGAFALHVMDVLFAAEASAAAGREVDVEPALDVG